MRTCVWEAAPVPDDTCCSGRELYVGTSGRDSDIDPSGHDGDVDPLGRDSGVDPSGRDSYERLLLLDLTHNIQTRFDVTEM